MEIIEDDNDITWGNNANELNASYAADGYARIKGIGALVTTFGVGELSAINGVAGAYSERVPIIHIVGSPRLQLQKEGAQLHHSLANGDFSAFTEMAGKVTCAHTRVDKGNALAEIDRVIEQAFIQKLPGYINIPIDLFNFTITADLKPLKLKLLKCSEKVKEVAINMITSEIFKAFHPVIFVDALVDRFQATEEVRAFVKKSRIPTFTTPMAKGVIPDSYSNYRGCYNGKASLPEITEEIEKADLVIEIGPFKVELNTGYFSSALENKKIIVINPTNTVALDMTYDNLGISQLLPHITIKLPKYGNIFDFTKTDVTPKVNLTNELTQEYLWSRFKSIVEPDSVVLIDIGSSMFKLLNLKSHDNVKFIAQYSWCSIGFTVGATLGVALASRKRRVYLFVGDGAFQMAAQELSVFLHHGVTPVIIIINNDGYLIEKVICGPQREYNNFQMWNYSKSFDYFGGNLERNTMNKKHAKIGLEAKVTTSSELDEAIVQIQNQKDRIHLVEVVTPEFSMTTELEKMAEHIRI
jgi:pyruvate decarboxylase